MKFLKNKKAESGETTSTENVMGAVLAVAVIIVITAAVIAFSSSFNTEIDKPTENGFKALVYSMKTTETSSEITVLNLGKYYLGQLVDCSSKCLCLYDKDNKRLAKECFSKQVEINTEDRQIRGEEGVSVLVIKSQDKIILTGSSSSLMLIESVNTQTGKCCVCKYTTTTPETGTCQDMMCEWADITDSRCKQMPSPTDYGSTNSECCQMNAVDLTNLQSSK